MELIYRFISANPYDTFDEAETLRGQLGKWRFVLDGSQVLATTDESFDSEADARAALEPLLRAWDAVAYLRDQHEVSFVADGAEPPAVPPAARDRIYMRSNQTYPAPDPDFARTATADRLLELVGAYAFGSAKLAATLTEAAAVLSDSARELGGSVADVYSIDGDVVDKVDELITRAGNYRGPEWQWMQEALRLLTLQAGRRDDSPPSERLRMRDFRTELAITDLQRRSL